CARTSRARSNAWCSRCTAPRPRRRSRERSPGKVTASMPFADANGQRLYYEVAGEGEPLLMVMGLGADHLAWALQVPALGEHFQVVTYDNRDCGQSSYAEGPYEITDLAADAVALADALELDSFHL